MGASLHRLSQEDLPRLRDFWVEYWGSENMIMHGEIIRYDQVEGFLYED